MNQKLLTKVLATTLAVILTFTNFVMLGVYASKTYATVDTLENQKTASNNENVEFDAYFMDGSKTHTIIKNIKEEEKLYLSINVKKGYLKNAKVEILGENGTSANFKITNTEQKLEAVENINVDTNTITFKQLNSGTQIILEVPVKSLTDDLFDLSNFSKINNIKLTGLYVSNEGNAVNVEKTILTQNIWHEDVIPVLEQVVKAYIPYTIGEQTGTILQTVINAGLENNALPINNTQISVKVPEINGVKPEKVIVNENNINATNISWNYDENAGIINIVTNNEQSENKVKWNKNGNDEYLVTYIYAEKLENIQAEQIVNSTINAYNDVKTEVKKSTTLTIQENETKGNIIEAEVISEDVLSKGALYTKSGKSVEYNEKVVLGVAYKELADKLVVENNIDNFTNEQKEAIQTANNTYYKTTSISKANLEKILGSNGYIKIIGAEQEQLAILNNESPVDENGNYTYTYKNEVNQIKIETSKIEAEGKLEINHVKVLKGIGSFTKQEVESFKNLNLSLTASLEALNTKIATVQTSKDIALVAPSTKIETLVSTSNLSTVVKNENVEIRAILKTNDITCDLYKNPVVEIVLPNYIAELKIKDVNLLFDNELSIKEYKTYVNENGNIVIQVQINGEDTIYNQDEITKGANLVINTDITLKSLTPTKSDVIRVYVTNENATSYENIERAHTRSVVSKAYAETELKAVAPVGMVTTNEITNYNTKNEKVTSISGEAGVGKLTAKTDSKVANISMNVINNYQNIVKNISILGRVPFSGNKDVVTGEALGSNLSLTLASVLTANGIDASKVTVYYSQNETATKDLENQANGWTTSIQDLSTVKSYLIVLNDYEMATGTTLTFNYNINIPENLSHNMTTYATYAVYFDNISQDGTTSEKAVATKVGLSTGVGPELEVNISSDSEAQNVEEGKVITYTISVKNVGKEAVKNVTVIGNIPAKTVYTYFQNEEGIQDSYIPNTGTTQMYDESVKNYTKVIENINVGETKTIKYSIETKVLNEREDGTNKVDNALIEAQAKATVESYDTVFTSNKVNSTLIEGYLKASLKLSQIPETYPRDELDEVKYIMEVQNVNLNDKNNVVAYLEVPEGLQFKNATKDGKYNETTGKVEWNIGTLKALDTKNFSATFTVNKLQNDIYEKEITNSLVVKTNEKEVISNEITFKVQKANLVVSQTSETKNEVSVGDAIIYNIIVENKGKGTARNVKITDYIPEGLRYDSVQYSINGKTYEASIGNGNGVITLSGVDAGTVIDIKLKAVATELENGTSKREVTNIVKVTADGMSEVSSNEIRHTIIAKSSSSTNDPSTEKPVEGTYKISGLAWLDANGNGRRDDNESTIGNISVVLINADNGEIVKDVITGKNKIQETNENGQYTFANLKPGKYMVIFLYDAGNYGLTAYKPEGINDDKNSDVVSMNVNMYGEVRKAGVSDKLELSSKDIENIDMGLVVNPQFDLRLDKVITKITVNDVKGTKEYNYKDSKLAKLDLNEKTINGTTIIVEYKIRITNEGGVAGYAKKIVDYLPKDMKFTSELNKDWYTSDNGNVYNQSLANTLIAPGETKELTLLLTKQMTGENTGLINNNAEIAESYNDLGLADIDSICANKVQNEDDMSNADALIGIKTGEIYVYILITITSIAILGVGIYFINKKVLRRI